MNNLDSLLSGKILLKEISPLIDGYRTWIELSFIDSLKPVHPFRVEPYAMIGPVIFMNPATVLFR